MTRVMVLLVLLSWVTPSEAAACSPPRDGGVCAPETPNPVPFFDATDVPLNVEVDLSWVSPALVIGAAVRVTPSTTFRLRGADGVLVELERSSTTGRWRPTSELRAHTRYAIEDIAGREAGDVGCARTGEHVEVASFTTGDARDDVAPATPSEGRFDACCRYEACDNGACCGPYMSALRGVRFTLEAGTVAQYRVEGGGAFFAAGPVYAGTFTMGMFGHPAERPTFGGGLIEARAVDAAGNVSEWSAVLSVPGCDPTSRPDGGPSFGWSDTCVEGPDVDRDAGPGGHPDTGAPRPLDAGMDGGVSAEPAPEMSCSASRPGARPVSPAWFAGLGLVLLRVVRRRQGAVQVPR